jgi:hypothetical protein
MKTKVAMKILSAIKEKDGDFKYYPITQIKDLKLIREAVQSMIDTKGDIDLPSYLETRVTQLKEG